MIDQQFIEDALNESRESIKNHVKQRIMDGISERFKWSLPDEVAKEVDAFVKAEIIPEVRKQLIEDKAIIVEAATAMAKGIALEVATAVQKKVAENLANDYCVREIMEKLAKGY